MDWSCLNVDETMVKRNRASIVDQHRLAGGNFLDAEAGQAPSLVLRVYLSTSRSMRPFGGRSRRRYEEGQGGPRAQYYSAYCRRIGLRSCPFCTGYSVLRLPLNESWPCRGACLAERFETHTPNSRLIEPLIT